LYRIRCELKTKIDPRLLSEVADLNTGVSALMRYILSPLLAPPSIPPQRGEEKDKLLILERVGGGVTLYLITSVSAVIKISFL
ncbi:MAG: hypothetical protein ACKO86_13940, partial [Dolichospermum sp.]